MKKYAKKILCGIALCGIALCSIGILSGFGVNAVRGYAAEEGASAHANTDFEMEGATVRLSNPTGLRFTAKIDTTSYEAPTVADAENTQERTVSYGVLIFPMNVLEHYMLTTGEYTKFQGYVEGYDYLKGIKDNAAAYVKEYGIIDIESIPVPVDEDNDETTDYYRINGSIANVRYNNIGREFFGLAYKKVGTYDENSASYSYEYTYANFGNKSNVWSLSYVASAAYAKDWEGSTDTDKETLQGFIKNALLKEAGVQEEDVANVENFKWTLSLSKPATELTVGATESLTWGTSVTVSGQKYAVTPDLYVKYASSDPSVVEVSEDGTLRAMKAGTATITVSCMDKKATCEVTVSAAEVTLDYLTFEVKGGDHIDGNNITSDDKNSSITVNVTENQNPIVNAYVYMLYDGLQDEAETKLTFTVTNNWDSALKIDVGTLGKGGGSGANVVNVNVGETVDGKGRITVAGKESVVVTVEFEKAIKDIDHGGFRLCFYPYAVNKTAANFTISKVYVGEYTAGPTKLATPVVNVNEQGSATWDAVDNATSYEYIIDDGEKQSTTEIISVQLTDRQKIKVRACTTDTANYTDSDWSAEVVYDTNFYAITVNSCTASATTARAGTLITLTAEEAPEGQVFDKWVVEAQEDVVFTNNNTFIMPACNVTVTATYKADMGTTSVGEMELAHNDDSHTKLFSVSGKVLTIKEAVDVNSSKGVKFTVSNWDSEKAAYVKVTVKNNTSGNVTIKYKVKTNTGDGYGYPDLTVKVGETGLYSGITKTNDRSDATNVTLIELFIGAEATGTIEIDLELCDRL